MIDRLVEWAAARYLRAALLLLCVALSVDVPGFVGLFPMDRDEPRFAQASKQMLETGDFVDIRFQGEARNKKPVGIYWMQAAVVGLADRLGLPEARRTIWLYRIPSLLGALAAALATYWVALALIGRRGALIAGLFMACVPLLVVEAHLAKTDAVVCATVVIAMGVFARAWMERRTPEPLTVGQCAVFWTALAIGILVKGPITPLVPILAGLVLSIRERSGRWLGRLRPLPGFVLCLLLVLPWFVLIVERTGWSFFSDSVGHDMVGKVAGGQEAHGAPPGTYLLAFWATAWPLAPFAFLAAPMVWRERRGDAVLYLLAWLVPFWLILEAVPTKLPHYVLPLYPAVAILVGFASERALVPARWQIALFAALLALLVLAVPAVLIVANGQVTSHLDALSIALGLLATVAALGAVYAAVAAVRRGTLGSASVFASIAAIAVFGFLLGRMLNARNADRLAISPRLAQAAEAAIDGACAHPAYASAGDAEPSLVFLTDTGLLIGDGVAVGRFMNDGPCRVAFVDRAQEAEFLHATAGEGSVRLASRVAGININGGKKLDIGVYVRQENGQ